MEEFNVSAFLLINQYAGSSEILDTVLITAAEITPYLYMLIMAYLWFHPGVERKGIDTKCIEKKRASFNAGLAVLVGMLINKVISLFYYHPRPFADNIGIQLIEHAPNNSFPSDHTTFIFSIAVMLLFNKATRAIGVILCALSLVSGLSRVFGGVHYPLDIFGAIIVAIISSVIVFKCQSKTNILLALLIKIMPNLTLKRGY